MDSDPEDSDHIVVPILVFYTMLWAMDGIRQKRED